MGWGWGGGMAGSPQLLLNYLKSYSEICGDRPQMHWDFITHGSCLVQYSVVIILLSSAPQPLLSDNCWKQLR